MLRPLNRAVRFVQTLVADGVRREHVGVPENPFAAAAVESPRLLPETVDGVVPGDPARYDEAVVQVTISTTPRLVPMVLEDDRAVTAVRRERERPPRDDEAHVLGVERDRRLVFRHTKRCGVRHAKVRRERGALVKVTRLRNLQPQEIGADDVSAKLLLADAQEYAVGRLLYEDDVAEWNESRSFH